MLKCTSFEVVASLSEIGVGGGVGKGLFVVLFVVFGPFFEPPLFFGTILSSSNFNCHVIGKTHIT
jgi:hypothetical protein